jgi:hypothetical protein
LCRDPEERLFIDGAWHEDLISPRSAAPADWAEWRRFLLAVDAWVGWRDAAGRRAFSLPAASSSDDAEVVALDRITMSDWLDEHRFVSTRVRWLIDYACRDDYGATADLVSAWAGLFYFAARIRAPGAPAQPLLTWPEGNGRLIAHLHARSRGHAELGCVAVHIAPATPSGAEVFAYDASAREVVAWRAEQVIFAAPQFVAPHVIAGYREQRAVALEFTYGAWLVANLHLSARPREMSFPLAWDNVLYDSPSVGYVDATHQSGRDHGPTVWTYYYPLRDENPRHSRERLLALDWSQCAEIALSDLERAHPDLRSLVERLDVMRWGHAMIRPKPGFRYGAARAACGAPFGSVQFAHSDLSGLPLFEEAFHNGAAAAEAALNAIKGSG